MTDEQREERISQLRAAVRSWADRHQLWADADLRSYAKHFNDRPEKVPYVLVLVFDGEPLCDLFNGYHDDCDALLDDFSNLLDEQGFEWARLDGCTVVISPSNDQDGWYEYYYFRWLRELVRPGYIDVSAEVLEHFQSRPDDLHKLEPRAFEVFVDAIFRNNGFRTELGPGKGDGGVDVRLYRSDLVGELLTLVQLKRYKVENPVGLEAVAALKAIVDVEKANSGLFITTSRYLPVAHEFARRSGRVVQLADKADIARWCATAADAVTRETERNWIEQVFRHLKTGAASDSLIGCVVHAQWGYNMCINDFRLVVRETRHAVLLAPLRSMIVSHEGFRQSGLEVPDFAKEELNIDQLCVAKRSEHGTFWGERRHFKIWDGQPKAFHGD